MPSMDHKPARRKIVNIIDFLPSRAFNVQRYNPRRGFSRPLLPIEARRNEKNGTAGGNGGFDTEEPTSPEVSCIGRIKHKKNVADARSKNPPPARRKTVNILDFLPSRAFNVQRYNPRTPRAGASAARMKKLHGIGFSGLLLRIEARRKEKNGTADGKGGLDTDEPTSPQVSCIGRIKHEKNVADARSKNPPLADKHAKKDTTKEKLASWMFVIHRIFGRKARMKAPEDESVDEVARGLHVWDKYPAPPVRAPSLGQMTRFASGRETLGTFNWKKVERMREKAAEDGDHDVHNWRSNEDEEDDDVIIPHSASIMIGGGEWWPWNQRRR